MSGLGGPAKSTQLCEAQKIDTFNRRLAKENHTCTDKNVQIRRRFSSGGNTCWEVTTMEKILG